MPTYFILNVEPVVSVYICGMFCLLTMMAIFRLLLSCAYLRLLAE